MEVSEQNTQNNDNIQSNIQKQHCMKLPMIKIVLCYNLGSLFFGLDIVQNNEYSTFQSSLNFLLAFIIGLIGYSFVKKLKKQVFSESIRKNIIVLDLLIVFFNCFSSIHFKNFFIFRFITGLLYGPNLILQKRFLQDTFPSGLQKHILLIEMIFFFVGIFFKNLFENYIATLIAAQISLLVRVIILKFFIKTENCTFLAKNSRFQQLKEALQIVYDDNMYNNIFLLYQSLYEQDQQANGIDHVQLEDDDEEEENNNNSMEQQQQNIQEENNNDKQKQLQKDQNSPINENEEENFSSFNNIQSKLQDNNNMIHKIEQISLKDSQELKQNHQSQQHQNKNEFNNSHQQSNKKNHNKNESNCNKSVNHDDIQIEISNNMNHYQNNSYSTNNNYTSKKSVDLMEKDRNEDDFQVDIFMRDSLEIMNQKNPDQMTQNKNNNIQNNQKNTQLEVNNNNSISPQKKNGSSNQNANYINGCININSRNSINKQIKQNLNKSKNKQQLQQQLDNNNNDNNDNNNNLQAFNDNNQKNTINNTTTTNIIQKNYLRTIKKLIKMIIIPAAVNLNGIYIYLLGNRDHLLIMSQSGVALVSVLFFLLLDLKKLRKGTYYTVFMINFCFSFLCFVLQSQYALHFLPLIWIPMKLFSAILVQDEAAFDKKLQKQIENSTTFTSKEQKKQELLKIQNLQLQNPYYFQEICRSNLDIIGLISEFFIAVIFFSGQINPLDNPAGLVVANVILFLYCFYHFWIQRQKNKINNQFLRQKKQDKEKQIQQQQSQSQQNEKNANYKQVVDGKQKSVHNI